MLLTKETSTCPNERLNTNFRCTYHAGNVMDVLEEENPLEIKIQSTTKVAVGFKNSVGRPTKKNEILFSTPPKSIISLILCKEKDLKVKENQNETNVFTHDTNIIIEKAVKPNVMIEKTANKWTCELCSDRIFYKKNKYKEHSKSHRKFKCDYQNCSYSTKFASNLKTHKRIHSSDYLYVCDECTFRTKFINSLKTHKRLHSRELPFACQYCEYKCNSGSNLKKHCTRKHFNIPNFTDDLK